MKATLKAHGREYQVTLRINRYANNKNLCIEVIDHSNGYEENFATMTTNLVSLGDPEAAYVDTNNCPWAEEFITRTGIGIPSGLTRKSGFCEYPLYYFNVDTIDDRFSNPDEETPSMQTRTWTDPNGFVCEQIKFSDEDDSEWRTIRILYATKS